MVELIGSLPGVSSVEVVGESPTILRVETTCREDTDLVVAGLVMLPTEPSWPSPEATVLVIVLE
jgi:hypothetical protein